MTTPIDPLLSWLQWLERQQNCDEDADATQPNLSWHLFMSDSLEQLARILAKSPNWQDTLSKQIDTASREAVSMTQGISTLLPPDIAWLSQLVPAANKNRHDTASSLAGGLFSNVASWPALGLTPTDENQWQTFENALPEARKAAHAYALRVQRMMIDALNQWHNDITAKNAEPPSPDALQDTWLQALEQAWQSLLSDPEYASILLQYNKAIAKLRTHGTPIANNVLHAFGLPTRSDLQGTQQRLQQLRRKQRSMDAASEIAALRNDIAALREEVALLRNDQNNTIKRIQT